MSDTPLQQLTAALADRYRVLREIGRGGMATVYLADDPKHRRQVAIKVFEPELAAVARSWIGFSGRSSSPPASPIRTSFRSTIPAWPTAWPTT